MKIQPMVLVYFPIAAVSATIGYWLAAEPNPVTQIYHAEVPSSPPDQELRYSHFLGSSSHSLFTENVALIRERDPEGKVHTMYWAPRRPNEWGSVELYLKWDSRWGSRLAVLQPSLHILSDYDATAKGELAIASEATGNRWVVLGVIGSQSAHYVFPSAIDITRWVRGSQSLRIRYRLKATRLMYHPTPNDPIGLAAAQCLREMRGGEEMFRLQIWKDLDLGAEKGQRFPENQTLHTVRGGWFSERGLKNKHSTLVVFSGVDRL